MPYTKSWMRRIPDILQCIEASHQQYFDRRDIELLFEVRRTVAGELLHAIGRTLALDEILGTGTRLQSLTVARKDLIQFVSEALQSKEFSQEKFRRDAMQQRLVETANILMARRVPIRPLPEVHSVEGLPPGIKLQPRHLEIDFDGTEDLLKHLYALSQAVMADFARFQRLMDADVVLDQQK